MMPLLPLINDTRENVEAIVRRAKDAGASYILPMFGVTLRSGSREHFHATLDREFPGLKARYEACFGNRYKCFSPSYRKLDDTFRNLCAKLGLETRMRFYAPTLPEQGSLF
jgi:DNA repair photolyase